jgi:hypothetical protein
MNEARKTGINFFDSAEGKCEIAVGKAIKALKWKRERDCKNGKAEAVYSVERRTLLLLMQTELYATQK